MGFLSKVLGKAGSIYNNIVDSVGIFDGHTATAKAVEQITGLSPSEQLAAGAAGGALISNMSIGGLENLGNMENGLTSLGKSLSSGISSFANSLGSLGNSLLSGIGSLGSSFASGLSALGSNLLQPLENYYNLERQWKYQKQAMNLQDTFNQQAEQRQNKYNIQAENRAMQNNIKLWNMQNEYNSPAAQMQRLKDAGLNPNLAYGSVNTTSGGISAPASHSVSTRANKALQRQAFALNYQQIVSNQLQNQLLMEQISDKRASRAMALEQLPLDNSYKQAQIDAIKNGISVRDAQLGLSYSKFDYEKEQPKSAIGRNLYDARNAFKRVKKWFSPRPDIDFNFL